METRSKVKSSALFLAPSSARIHAGLVAGACLCRSRNMLAYREGVRCIYASYPSVLGDPGGYCFYLFALLPAITQTSNDTDGGAAYLFIQ